MEVTHGSHLPFTNPNATHRPGGLTMKTLHLGTPSTPENFSLGLYRQNGFFSPRHRHNFDQFRYSVTGNFNLGPGLDIKPGQIAYHPEGVAYGPQNDGDQEQDLLVLQFGGASGQGYLSLEQVKAANRELMKTGKFEAGKYYSDDGNEGVDGYEAAWSYAMEGKKLEYPQGRYNTPIVMDPDSFGYKKMNGGVGVARKLLGVFSEREVVVEMLKVEGGGKVTVGGDDAIHLLYVLDGEGEVGGEKLVLGSSVRLWSGTSGTVGGRSGIEMLHFVMPMFM